MSNTCTPRAATTDDAGPIARSLSLAFTDDPLMSWLLPDADTRGERLARYFGTLFHRQYGPHGRCELTDSAAAFWVPPESRDKAVPDAGTVAELTAVLGDRAPLLGGVVEQVVAHTPQEPHWYLAVIGADPAVRGQGHGAALLRSGLAQADAAGLPVHLESSKPENIPFYAHFGFTVTAELRPHADGPTLWPMWRPAQR
ncbi:GNAT family N-acetyltransferase [Streptomyces sp. Ru73]|uniref:GNAT family N-acetyltransferase n=1 Tax=Streptomyces sp. Ru73 TaxID=2080748 RepID=UPI000CDCFAFA|nr:GNAT family N-acetyltransferase [Streptomyces sp. Ru73]POX38704.1 GNAT family N-acetyltransferase [Streptomyces sp. Ru73]